MFLWKILNNNTSWNIGVAFRESSLSSISEANECLTGVNTKRNQEAQRQGKRQPPKMNTAL